MPHSPKMVGLRFRAAARPAGVEHMTDHSRRVGLASGLTSPRCVDDGCDAGRELANDPMVVRYSAGATAERGAVARYL